MYSCYVASIYSADYIVLLWHGEWTGFASDVAGAVVAIHNVPGEGDVGVVFVAVEVANYSLSICEYFSGRVAITLRQYVVGPCLPHL